MSMLDSAVGLVIEGARLDGWSAHTIPDTPLRADHLTQDKRFFSWQLRHAKRVPSQMYPNPKPNPNLTLSNSFPG